MLPGNLTAWLPGYPATRQHRPSKYLAEVSGLDRDDVDAELSQLQPQDLAIEKVNMIQAKGVWPKGVWPEFNVLFQHSSVYYSTKPKQHS